MNNNINKSIDKIENIYNNLTYFDNYGTSIFIFIILSVIVILVNSYFVVLMQMKNIKSDWVNQRCNPNVLPFAGFINKPKDKSILDYTQENFTYCTQNILKTITGRALEPLTYTITLLETFYLTIMHDIQNVRGAVSSFRKNMEDVSKEIMGRTINIMVPIQQMIIAVKDVIMKIQGTMTAALYTSLGSYYTLKSLMGAILELVIIFLIALASVIIIMWILPFTWGVAASMTAIFISLSIPLAIIAGVMTEVLHIHTSGIPSVPVHHMSSCFDKDTKLKMNDKSYKKICDIIPGDRLNGNVMVTAIMKLDATKLDMYNLNDIIVSGDHVVKYKNGWIKVREHPYIKRIEYHDKYVYCINTTNKIIKINNIIFTDWDEVYEKILYEVKEKLIKKYNLEKIKTSEIYKYTNTGYFENTLIRMRDDTHKKIKDINVNDILYKNTRVYGLVEIYNLGGAKKYNLLTDNTFMYIDTNMIYYNDYNFNIDSLLT